MKLLQFSDPEFSEFVKSLNRRAQPATAVSEIVDGIIAQVKTEGDKALVALAQRFDNVSLAENSLRVSQNELDLANRATPQSTREAIASTRRNIHAFAKQSLRQDWSMKNEQGARVGERFRPFQRVGIYVPGGKAPLVSTALMTGAFAQAAGVPEIVAATPCGPDGCVNPALLYALQQAGATEIYKIGGAQAIAALSLGTASIAPVQKIFGPGNKFVVEAKRQLIGAVAIDLLPGPSEVLVLADHSANPAFVAADLLAQAEHGGDSIVGFLTTCKDLLARVEVEIARQAATLSRGAILQFVLENYAFALLVPDLETGVQIANSFAPEHLSLIVENEEYWVEKIRNAGAIYLGNFSPVAVGDFLAGPSHTLPTGGAAKSFSGLRADQFQLRTSIVQLDAEAVAKSRPAVEEFAKVEGLDAHGRSVSIRLDI